VLQLKLEIAEMFKLPSALIPMLPKSTTDTLHSDL